MGDIAFLLIIFFILASIPKGQVELAHPKADDLGEIEKSGASVVMDEEGQCYFQGDEVPVEALVGLIKGYFENPDKDRKVVVEIDRNPEKTPADDQVDPDALMVRINGLSFLSMFLVSLIIHAVLIGATSIEFIQQCVEYNTLAPGVVIREKARKERAEERRKKRAERQDAEAKLVAAQKGKGAKSTTKPKSKIEQKINQKSTTLPAKSGVKLDDIDDL